MKAVAIQRFDWSCTKPARYHSRMEAKLTVALVGSFAVTAFALLVAKLLIAAVSAPF